MGCLTIDTETLLANFFGSPEYEKSGLDKVGIDTIEKCAITLANNLPGYVFYDTTRKSIRKLSEKNKGFILDGDIVYYRGDKINRHKYNRSYINWISNSIEDIVDSFFKYRVFEKSVKRIAEIDTLKE